MLDAGRTQKIAPLEVAPGVELEEPDHHARLVTHLRAALDEAGEVPAGDDIADAIRQLLAMVRECDALPDITHLAEVA